MEQKSDFILLNNIQKGESLSFESLFKKYYASLCVFAVRYTHDLDSAREIVQNIFVYLWENRTDVKIDRSVKAYLTVSVRRNCIRFVQQQRPTTSIDAISEDEHLADDLHDSLELEELYQQLLDAIEQLPDQCKRIFKLSRFEELKYSEIAEKLGLSVKTVEAQMGKALKALRKRFENNSAILWLLITN